MSWINLSALWKIIVYGFILGAGLPALFAVGLRALALPGGGRVRTATAGGGGGARFRLRSAGRRQPPGHDPRRDLLPDRLGRHRLGHL